MRLVSLLSAAILATATLAAHADSYTVSTNTGAFRATFTSEGDTALSIAKFNSALGTLTSINFALDGSYTSGGPDNIQESPNLDVTSQINGGFSFISTESSNPPGTYSVDATGQTSYAPELALFTGAGNATAYFDFYDSSNGGTDSSPGLTFSVTYNYTPAAPPPTTVTPEPASLTLLGTGLLATVGVLRRRLA